MAGHIKDESPFPEPLRDSVLPEVKHNSAAHSRFATSQPLDNTEKPVLHPYIQIKHCSAGVVTLQHLTVCTVPSIKSGMKSGHTFAFALWSSWFSLITFFPEISIF